jgi:DNA-binding response OmpR family regulator
MGSAPLPQVADLMRLLLVEDDLALGRALEAFLKNKGFALNHGSTLSAASNALRLAT